MNRLAALLLLALPVLPAAAQSYLNIPAIIAACEITGAQAIHH